MTGRFDDLERAKILAAGPFDPAVWYDMATRRGRMTVYADTSAKPGIFQLYGDGPDKWGNTACMWFGLLPEGDKAALYDWLVANGIVH